jgi:hypothetical protein
MRGFGGLAAAVIALSFAGCGNGPLARHGLDAKIEAARSLAAEGALLAEQVAHGETTTPYVRVHSGELTKQARSLDRSLANAHVQPGLADLRARASRLTGQVGGALDRLHSSPGDRALAAQLRERLDRAAQELGEIGS